MTKQVTHLNELEHDLLTELFNIGVGKAAASLSEMLKQEIKLTCPSIKFCTLAEVIKNFSDKEKIITVSQYISGIFDMQSVLVFPSSGSTAVIRAMLGSNLSEEMATEMQQEAFTEIGNIVLNACIGIIAKTMNEHFEIDLPKFDKDLAENIFIEQINSDGQVVMSMKVDLFLTSSSISGYIAFVLGSVSMETLKSRLNVMLNELT